jgi:type VI secretion system secreted protein Hcp
MPIPAYMSIEGETQGLITEGCNTEDSIGNTFQEAHEDEFLVQQFNHQIIVPTDPQSGQPSGQRVHKPITLVKVYDRASPLLFQALCTGERLPECVINWFRITNEGIEELYFSHTLEDATIVDISPFMPNAQDPAMSHFRHMEKISLVYRKISWAHEVAGTEGSDDWREHGGEG